MEELIQHIQETVNRKQVQSLCKKILKKCSFKSKGDLANVSTLAVWLYVYGYEKEAMDVCDILLPLEFTGNYDLWGHTDLALCLKARILREQGITEGREELLNKVNEHRDAELYQNNLKWYTDTVNRNIESDDAYHPGKIIPGWRMEKLRHAIRYREAGGYPLPDEVLEEDIGTLKEQLLKVK